ncbi:MAG: hypothetical protein JF606_20530 [Burkholderiales bacterium]|nr:hypothetical protein [Burkholderiales bacterium]
MQVDIDSRTSFGPEFAPTPENIRTQFRLLRETSGQFDEASAMWQSAASQFSASLKAARKAHACAAVIESLKRSISECEAAAARLAIKHDVAEAVLAVKQLGPRPWPHVQIIAQANHHLEAAIERHRTYACTAPLHTLPIEGFDMALRDIASVAQQLRDSLPAAHLCAVAAGYMHDLALSLSKELASGITDHVVSVSAPRRAPSLDGRSRSKNARPVKGTSLHCIGKSSEAKLMH